VPTIAASGVVEPRVIEGSRKRRIPQVLAARVVQARALLRLADGVPLPAEEPGRHTWPTTAHYREHDQINRPATVPERRHGAGSDARIQSEGLLLNAAFQCEASVAGRSYPLERH
jgi:hypothetical protein